MPFLCCILTNVTIRLAIPKMLEIKAIDGNSGTIGFNEMVGFGLSLGLAVEF